MGMLFSSDFLYKPVREKTSSDQSNEKLSYGSSSMQGWREEQEDAHNNILDFDTNSSFFAVYDGHGGPEVAEYCANKLPDFLKALDSYKAGDIEKALVDAFLGLDATITSSEVMAELKIVSSESKQRIRRRNNIDRQDNYKEEQESEEENNEAENLKSKNPLEKVMEKRASDVEKEETKPRSDKKGVERTKETSKSRSLDNKPQKNGLDIPEIEITECESLTEKTDKLETPKNDKVGKKRVDPKVAEKNQNGKVGTPENNCDDDSESTDDSSPTEVQDLKICPGYRSGCTAVVALLVGNELYVANAGDSRCIICRNGKVEEMSFDHKPEDALETARVVKAGGRVREGRVEGELNLSRAFGDHRHKLNTELSDREQMITALPDIKRLTIKPGRDEFMVVACDGIWNSLSNDEVIEFIRTRLQDEDRPKNLSQICEEMFDHCLAPDTMGGIAGVDNMTCVIVEFKPALITGVTTTAATTPSPLTHKRPDSSPVANEPSKKPKSELSTTESSTTTKANKIDLTVAM